MKERTGILAAGNWIVDNTKIVDVYPREDSLANIRSESTGNGGAPYNVICNLSQLAVTFPLEALGLLGDDDKGKQILEDCESRGIDIRQLQVTSEAPTSYTDVMCVQTSGRRTFFHQRGANAFLGPEHFHLSKSNAKILHIGYLLLLDRLDQPDPEYGTVAARILHEASLAGFQTSIDVVSEDSDRFPEIVMPALRYVDFCILNELEAERTTGISIPPMNEALPLQPMLQAAEALFSKGVRQWVVIHTPAGALAYGGEGKTCWQGSVKMPAELIRGTLGAGDAFAAGMLYGLHQGESIEHCMKLGVCVAASSLLEPEASRGVLPLPSCLELGVKYGFRENEN